MAGDILRTPLCDLFDIEYPIILAGMGGTAGPTLAAAVSNAGGLGVIGATGYTPDEMHDMIRKVKSLTDKPFGVDLLIPSAIAQSGTEEEFKAQLPQPQVAFVNKLKEEFGIPEPKKPPRRLALTGDFYRSQVQVLIDERVPVFAAGLGNPAWMVPDAHRVGMKVIGLVGNVRNAKRVADGGADVVVAQGYDAGGHTGRIGTLALVPQVVDAIHPTPVVAAGGIADGRGLIASLALGAVGVWCGTAFLAAHEAHVDAIEMGFIDEWSAEQARKKLIAAVDEDARISRAYSGKTARILRNAWMEAWERPEAPPTLPMPLQSILTQDALAGAAEAHIEPIAGGPAGQIAGLIKELKPAKQIVDEMMEQARRIVEEWAPQERVPR